MNMEECKIQNLYALENTKAEPLLTRYTYPWEALKNIGDFIVEFGNKLPKEDYIVKGENVWISKTANIAETAYIKGPAIICDNAEIRHCAFIRGNAIVGKNVVVGNSTELKNVNWHGANTKNFITHVIGTNKIDDSNLILLKYLFGDNICLMCDSFVSDFKRCQPDLQEFIMLLFKKAFENNLLFPAKVQKILYTTK